MTSSNKRQERVALVTGASRGIGAASALRLAAQGYSIAVNFARSKPDAEAIVKQIIANGGRAVAIQADVSEEGAGRTSSAKPIVGWARRWWWSTTPGCSVPGR